MASLRGLECVSVMLLIVNVILRLLSVLFFLVVVDFFHCRYLWICALLSVVFLGTCPEGSAYVGVCEVS